MPESFHVLSTCPACGTRNRVSAAHLSDTGKCGACKTFLPPVNHPIDVDANSFDEILHAAKVPVLADFWAEWCGPCRMAAPEVRKLAKEVAGQAIVVKVDTEANPGIAARYNIHGIPNFIVFRGGKTVLQSAGVASSAEMRRWIEQAN